MFHHSHGGRRFSRHPFGPHPFSERALRYGRRERGGRVFESGDLKLLLLALIAEKPSHGYELIHEVEGRLGGVYSPSPGVVYPTLTLLEELGHIEVEAQDGGKKRYAATAAGRAHLEAQAREVERIFARINEAGARGGRATPQILRAMENLRTALRYRLAEGPLGEAEARALVEAIDEAAVKVERR